MTKINPSILRFTMISALCAVALLTSTASAQVQINCGGAASGSFIADADFTGGTEANTTAAITIPAAILNPAPQAVYQTERWGASTYTIPNLTPGQTYTVRLHFAEFYWTTAGQREFGVNINGAQVLPALPAAAGTFDIVATVGAPNTALVEAIQATANTAGQIVIQFIVGSADQPKISGIEVFASAPFGIDAGGVGAGTFMADLYFAGGTAATHSNAVDTSLLPAPVPPQEVLETERYGASTYTIPNLVPGQSYSVGLYFSENYFAAAGQREFNVSINGTAVLTNFDIYAATGAEYKAILKTYTATANAAGQIVIAFTNGAANNAKVDAIQIQSLNTTSPTIASLSPTSGLAGSAVTIAGTNFGATQGTSILGKLFADSAYAGRFSMNGSAKVRRARHRNRQRSDRAKGFVVAAQTLDRGPPYNVASLGFEWSLFIDRQGGRRSLIVSGIERRASRICRRRIRVRHKF